MTPNILCLIIAITPSRNDVTLLTGLSRGSYGVSVALAGSTWLLRGAHDNLPVSATYRPSNSHVDPVIAHIDPVTATRWPRRYSISRKLSYRWLLRSKNTRVSA